MTETTTPYMRTGGPAFPGGGVRPGMSLRDWFAGHALPALLGDPDYAPCSVSDLARRAYDFADAMILARAVSCAPAAALSPSPLTAPEGSGLSGKSDGLAWTEDADDDDNPTYEATSRAWVESFTWRIRPALAHGLVMWTNEGSDAELIGESFSHVDLAVVKAHCEREDAEARAHAQVDWDAMSDEERAAARDGDA